MKIVRSNIFTGQSGMGRPPAQNDTAKARQSRARNCNGHTPTVVSPHSIRVGALRHRVEPSCALAALPFTFFWNYDPASDEMASTLHATSDFHDSPAQTGIVRALSTWRRENRHRSGAGQMTNAQEPCVAISICPFGSALPEAVCKWPLRASAHAQSQPDFRCRLKRWNLHLALAATTAANCSNSGSSASPANPERNKIRQHIAADWRW